MSEWITVTEGVAHTCTGYAGATEDGNIHITGCPTLAKQLKPRRSRRRVAVDWSSIMDRISAARGGEVEVPKPQHLSILQTRDKVLALAKNRNLPIDYRIIMGRLYVWSGPQGKDGKPE